MSHAEKLGLFQEVSVFAKENDMSGSVSMTVGGDVYVYAKQSFGLDTDITIQANLQFNSQDGEKNTLTPE